MNKHGQKQEFNQRKVADVGDEGHQQWAGYQGYRADQRSPAINDDRQSPEKRVTNAQSGLGIEGEKRGENGVAPPASKAPGDDGFKNRYLKALKELNKVLEANKKMNRQMEQMQQYINELNRHQEEPKNSQILGEMQELRLINQQLEQKIREIYETNRDYQQEIEAIKTERQNLRKEADKARQLTWRLEDKERQVESLKGGYERQISNLNDTITKLQNVNATLRSQQTNLQDMYGGKEQANLKKISYLQSQLQETKAQLARQREKVNTEIQSMSAQIRKQTQSQLANYKLEMTKLKDTNFQYQRDIEKLNKQLRQVTERRADKKGSEQRQISQLQENVENCKKEIRRLKDNLSNTHNTQIQKQSLQREVKMLQNNIHALTEELAQARAKANSLQTTNEELLETNIKLDSEIKRLRAQSEKLDAQLKRKETILNRQKVEADTLKGRMAKMEVETSRNQDSGTRENISQLQDRIRQLKNKVHLLSASKDMFEEDRQSMELEKIQAINSMTSALEEKMDVIVADNSELSKKLLIYKDKCGVLERRLETATNEIRVLTVKVQKYENFVPKLEQELEKAIKQAEFAPLGGAHLNPSQSLLRDRLEEMSDRLVVEARYAKQELQTKCLEYESKIVTAKLEISKLKEALRGESFFHDRITELSQRLSDSENKKLELLKRIGDLQREKLLAERLPASLQKELQNNKIAAFNTVRQVEELRLVLLQKDREIARAKAGNLGMSTLSKSPEVEYQRQQLLQTITKLRQERGILERAKVQAQQRVWSLENEVQQLRQATQGYTIRVQPSQSEGQSEQVRRLKQESEMLKSQYFEFEEVRVKYQGAMNQNSRLREENQAYHVKQAQYQTKIESLQQMFDIVYKRLQDTMYQNTQLMNESNRLKGMPIVITSQMIPDFQQGGEAMSFQDPSKVGSAGSQFNQYLVAPDQRQTARFETREKREYKKQFQSALFGLNRDSDNSYDMEYRGDERYGQYY